MHREKQIYTLLPAVICFIVLMLCSHSATAAKKWIDYDRLRVIREILECGLS